MTAPTDKPARILVVLDASMLSGSALGMAAALAARSNTELRVLFVEDLNLIHLAEYPFAMEVDSMFGIERRVDSLTMARSLQSRIAQVRQMLSRVTRSARVQASLSVVRGHYVAEAFSACAEMDVLFLGREGPRTHRTLTITSARRAGVGSAQKKPVWLLFDGSEVSVRALGVATDLAEAEGRKLRIVVQAEDYRRARRLREQVGNLGHPVSEIRWIAENSAGIFDFLEMAKLEGCSLVVAKRPCDPGSDAVVSTLLTDAGCPVVLVA